jgi:REP element-mobilizing transposase RayT
MPGCGKMRFQRNGGGCAAEFFAPKGHVTITRNGIPGAQSRRHVLCSNGASHHNPGCNPGNGEREKNTMPQSLSKVIVHIIFGTKNREPFITREFAPQLHAYLASIAYDMGPKVFRVGGPHEHVHIACTLPRVYSQANFVQKIKATSSKWMKEQGHPYFWWQKGYGAFSVNQRGIQEVIDYIDNQWEHHKTRPFSYEYKKFLDVYGIEYDERYLWD